MRARCKRYPVLYDMVGFTGSGLAHVNWKPFGDNVPERAARLIQEKKMGPAIIVFPDCFTSLGGNQYVNSAAIGRYADYPTAEIIPFVDREFRTLASRDHRGCFGKSSGGYVVRLRSMAKHEVPAALLGRGSPTLSGDAYFDFVYRTDWPNTLNELDKHREPRRQTGRYDAVAEAKARSVLAEGRDDGRVRRFLDTVWQKEKLSHAEGHAIMNICMAATYDPDAGAPGRLPACRSISSKDRRRPPGALEELAEVHDPIHMVERYKANPGDAPRDLHRLWWVARPVSPALRHPHPACLRRLARPASDHVYEEFDDRSF